MAATVLFSYSHIGRGAAGSDRNAAFPELVVAVVRQEPLAVNRAADPVFINLFGWPTRNRDSEAARSRDQAVRMELAPSVPNLVALAVPLVLHFGPALALGAVAQRPAVRAIGQPVLRVEAQFPWQTGGDAPFQAGPSEPSTNPDTDASAFIGFSSPRSSLCRSAKSGPNL